MHCRLYVAYGVSKGSRGCVPLSCHMEYEGQQAKRAAICRPGALGDRFRAVRDEVNEAEHPADLSLRSLVFL